ncbi:MAG TPA: PilZ domain-containing protein [Qipengyuania sp.]|nr:PilZ domain-containing protein [Qipengyuania sp.]
MLSQALHARFADASEQRTSDRRVLRLEAQAATPAGENGIQIHNLSRTGMLVQSGADVPVGTEIEVEMPDATRHRAEVVWRDASLFGCRFAKPLAQATLSAALLRAAPAPQTVGDTALLVENDALARLHEHWNVEHEISAAREPGMPLGKRLWVIIGLGIACWAIPSAIVIWILW